MFQGTVGDLEEDLSLSHGFQGHYGPQARLLGQEPRPHPDCHPEAAFSLQPSQVKSTVKYRQLL